MLIIFDAPDDNLAEEPTEGLEAFFSELLRASMKGFHFVVVSRRSCLWALDNLSLNNREQAHLRSLGQGYTQSASLINEAFCFLKIEITNDQISERTTHKYTAGYKEILRGDYLSEATLLVENSKNDGDFYDHVLCETKQVIPIKQYHATIKHGGGSTVVDCFSNEIENKRIVVSLIDSDKKSPGDKKSEIAKKMECEEKKQTFIGMVCETVCCTAENHIPLDIWLENNLCPNYPEFQTLEQLIADQSVQTPTDCLWLFFNVKNGLDGKNLSEKNLDKTTLDWVLNKFSDGSIEIEQLSISGFGEAALSLFNASGPAKSAFHTFIRSPYWSYHFGEFFMNLYWYFVASKPKAIT